jgi:translation initiation factor IF-2
VQASEPDGAGSPPWPLPLTGGLPPPPVCPPEVPALPPAGKFPPLPVGWPAFPPDGIGITPGVGPGSTEGPGGGVPGVASGDGGLGGGVPGVSPPGVGMPDTTGTSGAGGGVGFGPGAGAPPAPAGPSGPSFWRFDPWSLGPSVAHAVRPMKGRSKSRRMARVYVSGTLVGPARWRATQRPKRNVATALELCAVVADFRPPATGFVVARLA